MECDFVTYVGSCSGNKERSGLILSISRGGHTAIALICFLDTKEIVQVPLKRCTKLATEVLGQGLVGLYVVGETYRKLRVVEERMINDVLHVAFIGLDGVCSPLLPAKEYRFCFFHLYV